MEKEQDGASTRALVTPSPLAGQVPEAFTPQEIAENNLLKFQTLAELASGDEGREKTAQPILSGDMDPEDSYKNKYCTNGMFSKMEAEQALAFMHFNSEVDGSWLSKMTINSLKILVGLSLCHQNSEIFA